MSGTNWNGVSGDWFKAADWSAGVPTPTTDALIAASGNYRITIGSIEQAFARSLDMNAAGAQLIVNGSLSVIGGAFDLQAGVVTLNGGGVLQADVLALDGGFLRCHGGLLAVGEVEGEIRLDLRHESLTIGKGVNFAGMGGAGAGLIKLTGWGASLTFDHADGGGHGGVIDNVTMFVGNKANADVIYLANDGRTPQDYVFGQHSDIIFRQQAKILSTAFMTNNGLIQTDRSGGANVYIEPELINNGQVDIGAGSVISLDNGLYGVGSVDISGGSELVLAGKAEASQTIVLGAGGAILSLFDAGGFQSTIVGLNSADKIDLLITKADGVSLNGADQLLVTNNGVAVATLQLAGDYSTSTFAIGGDGNGGSVITVSSSPHPSPTAMIHAMAALAPGAAHAGAATHAQAPMAQPTALARPARV